MFAMTNEAIHDELMQRLEEGKPDPLYKKVVSFIVLDAGHFYVFLDNEDEIQWSWHHTEDTKVALGNVLNRMAYLQSLARFSNGKNKRHFHRMIAEGLARFLDSSSEKQANEILSLAEKEIRELSLKISWRWYFNAAYLLTAISVALLLLLWLARDYLRIKFGSAAFDVVFATLIGSVGALISIIARGDRITLDANAGLILHITEGIARIVVGMCGAGLVALAMKAGILGGGFSFKGNAFASLLTFAFAAGASERIVPSLISRLERYSQGAESEKGRK